MKQERKSALYINRTIKIDGEPFAQSEILNRAGPIIVLAEPGFGKTALLDNLAAELGSKRLRADIFRHPNYAQNPGTLIIDGLDEVAKIDQSAIDAIVCKAAGLNATKVIFSCRAAQWEEARSRYVEDVFCNKPTIVHLNAFSEEEQRSFIADHKPEIDFAKFKFEAAKIEIGGLFGNPQMLKIFADGYVQSGGKFTSKQQVFADAVIRLASEKNARVEQPGRPTNDSIVLQATEIFAKILLSGCTGTALTESKSTIDYPYFKSIIANDTLALETNLFKPADTPNTYEPVHRIIAEYLGARYLVGRIQNPADRLSLARVLALIAPNSTPRDELRGLLAWMATEGSENIQQAVIALDPYAIFSNGDPAQLSPKSKVLLLERLAQMAKENPYFRSADRWRDFSVAGFFTADVTEAVAKLLGDHTSTQQLKNLLLELLRGTPAAATLHAQLRDIALNSSEQEYTRGYALACLLGLESHDLGEVFRELLNQNTQDSLSLAAKIIEKQGVATVGNDEVVKLLHALDQVYYPIATQRRPRDFGSRYFITTLIQSFSTEDVVAFLDALSTDLKCSCENRYECNCRKGRSKLIGMLLDRLFDLGELKPSAEQILCWVTDLRFDSFGNAKESVSIAALQSDDALRQQVQMLSIGRLTKEDEIRECARDFRFDASHAGLGFRNNDVEVLSNHAFENDNVALWSVFLSPHRIHAKENFADPLRAHMRAQAQQKPAFGRVWAQREQAFAQHRRQKNPRQFRRNKTMRKYRRREKQTKAADQKHFDDNIQQIEKGQDLFRLQTFANGYLRNNTVNFPEMDDKDLPVKALLNCFEFLKSHVPSLEQIGESNQRYDVIKVLNAATLAHYRKHGKLNGIDRLILEAVRTESGTSYSGGNDTDINAYNAEINRRIFQSKEDIETYLRRLIEPQLADPQRHLTNAIWLGYYKEFHPFRETLAIEWLERFPDMDNHSAEELFQLAAAHGDRNRVRAVVTSQLQNLGGPPNEEELLKDYTQKRDFWYRRQFFVFEECDAQTIAWLKESKDRLLAIRDIVDGPSRHNNSGWGTLSATKIHLILDIFIGQWLAVHLPNSWGTGSPPEETAYLFLSDIIWKIGNDAPSNALPVLNTLLADPRFKKFTDALKTQRFAVQKRRALQDYAPPSITDVVNMLDNQKIASVEDLRALLIEMLDAYQADLKGSETDPANYFYDKQTDGSLIRVDENAATKVVAYRLQLQCAALGISLSIEKHMYNNKRCDLTLNANIAGSNKLLVVEAKGQWHKDLYTAAAEQLDTRYTIHPNAADQGVYLIYYFGKDHQIAGAKNKDINSAVELRESILSKMDEDLKKRIDVFVLDISLP